MLAKTVGVVSSTFVSCYSHDAHQGDLQGGDENHKVGVVVDANAVVRPRAVVIEPFHALVADGTMSGARSADNFAVWAQLHWVNQLQQIL